MPRKKKISQEEERDRKFKEIKRRSEIKERYGVFTQKMFENLLEELRIKMNEDIKLKLDPLNVKLDWLIGEYKKFDEEYTLLSNKVSKHGDKLEIIEKKLGIYAN